MLGAEKPVQAAVPCTSCWDGARVRASEMRSLLRRVVSLAGARACAVAAQLASPHADICVQMRGCSRECAPLCVTSMCITLPKCKWRSNSRGAWGEAARQACTHTRCYTWRRGAHHAAHSAVHGEQHVHVILRSLWWDGCDAQTRGRVMYCSPQCDRCVRRTSQRVRRCLERGHVKVCHPQRF
jgi:hypothetical protein